MARYPGTEEILKAARDWRDRCLLDDRSIFTDQEIWGASNLTELHSRLQQYEEDQEPAQNGELDLDELLSGVSRGSRKLATEMFWVMLLFPSDDWDRDKQEWIRALWEGTGKQLPIKSQEYLDVLSPGISEVGSKYWSNLHGEFRFFLEFLQKWKEFSKSRRHGLMNKPWHFGQWLDELGDDREFYLRHMLLHLLFPEYFERIPTTSHKQTLVSLFSKFDDLDLETSPEEKSGLTSIPHRLILDVTLHQIRKTIEPMVPESIAVDFYDEPLESIWRPHEGEEDPSPEATSLEGLLPEKESTEDITEEDTETDRHTSADEPEEPDSRSPRWLWLSIDSNRWDIEETGPDHTEFLSYSDGDGRPRVDKEVFEKVKSGDRVLFFQTDPEARVVATGRVEQGLHDGTDVEGNKKVGISFRVDETLDGPSIDTLQEDSEFAGHNVIENPDRGTLFEIREEDFKKILQRPETEESPSENKGTEDVTEETREETEPADQSSETTETKDDTEPKPTPESSTSETEMSSIVSEQWSESEPGGQLAKLGAMLGFEVRQNTTVEPDSSMDVVWIPRSNGEEYSWTGFEIYEASKKDSTIVKFQKVLRQEQRVKCIVLIGEQEELSSFEEEISYLEEEMQSRIKYLPRQQLAETAQHINALNDFLSRLGWLDDEVQFGVA